MPKRKKPEETKEEIEEEPENRIKRFKSSYRNKQHTLVFCSRGITFRNRHLMNDLISLMPHAKTDVKFDDKHQLFVINEIAEMKNCTNTMFLECRKKQDLYIWFAKTPSGPSAKFHVTNVHTMNELKFAGNSLKGSRPMLVFDKSFDESPHFRLLKELFSQVFGTPKMHPKSKPFIDHALMFGIIGGRIWVRNYQIVEEFMPNNPNGQKDETNLMEIGPRFTMNLVKILDGSFTGTILYENPNFVSPNKVRAAAKNQKSMKFLEKVIQKESREAHHAEIRPAPDELDTIFGEDGDIVV